MVISRSSIPQQISKPGVKKMKQGRKTRRNTTPATKDIKKSLSKAKQKLKDTFTKKTLGKKGLTEENMKEAVRTASYLIPKYPYGLETLFMPTKLGAADLFSNQELKEMKRKEKENEKSINKYMGGSLNKGRK
jgi:hypothetical protein